MIPVLRPRHHAPYGAVGALGLLCVLAAGPAPSLADEPRVADERVLLHTAGGDIVLALFPEIAPLHVGQFLKLARLGVYDSTHFFNVVPGFHVQLSAAIDRVRPLSPEQIAAIRLIADELSALTPVRGNLLMARDPSKPDSAKASFLILLADWPQGKGRYTVFGRVESGMDVVDGFLRVPRNASGRPAERIEILSAEVVPAAELGKRRLIPAMLVGPAASLKAATAGLALLTALSAVGWFCRKRNPHAAASLYLVNVLIGFFLVVALWLPAAASAGPLWGSALFIALLGVIKLLTRFESPD